MAKSGRAVRSKRGPSKDTRFEARISSEDKDLLKKAASLKGMKYTAFALAAARQEARKVIEEENLIRLNREESEHLMKVLHRKPKAPNRFIKKAVQNYRDTVQSDVNPDR